MGTYTTTFSVDSLNSYRSSWSNDKIARQGSYNGSYPTEYVGRIEFSIGNFNTTKYKITGVTLTVNRNKIGNWGGSIQLQLYAGKITASDLRKSPSSYSGQKLASHSLKSYSNNPSTVTFTASDVTKFKKWYENTRKFGNFKSGNRQLLFSILVPIVSLIVESTPFI